MDKEKKIKEYPNWVCQECGSKASGGKQFDVSTWHKGICGVCGEEKSVTELRDFYYPKFNKIKLTATISTWKPCKHYGFYFRCWFKKFFVCIRCQTVFSKRQISFYRKYNKYEQTKKRD